MKKERLEDLGILFEKLKSIQESPIFQFANSKHDFDLWLEQFDKDDRSFDIHSRIRFINDQLDECICIAGGCDE